MCVNIFLQGMKKTRADAKKIGPLKLAALNGLSLSRLPLPDEGKEVSTRATNDERVSVCGGPPAGCHSKGPGAVLANVRSKTVSELHMNVRECHDLGHCGSECVAPMP